MILLRWTLTGIVIWAVILGLWEHDWRLILAGVATAVVWPLVQGEVTPHEAQPHHDPDHGSPDSSAARVGLPTDPRVLGPNDWVEDRPGYWTPREESALLSHYDYSGWTDAQRAVYLAFKTGNYAYIDDYLNGDSHDDS